jgi:catechol 2,3-dioxygenase
MADKEQTMTSIDPQTTIGAVRLAVSDLSRSREFYERAIGLVASELEDGSIGLGAPGSAPMIELHGDSAASPLSRRATGLYHLAILLPTRRDLAVALVRLAQNRWPLDGASNHLVSEALYLSDPDGNGIEIYRDRPRTEWSSRDGQIEMATIALDLDDIIAELEGATTIEPTVPASTAIGHVHLQVADINDAEAFYNGVLGFDVTVRGYPGALFVSAGGYHHHIGLNTWQSAGAAPPAAGSVGLRSFEVTLPDPEALAAVVDRIHRAGLPAETAAGGATLVRDPSGNGVLLTASSLSPSASEPGAATSSAR